MAAAYSFTMNGADGRSEFTILAPSSDFTWFEAVTANEHT
jgi:hypothetical protein